MVLLLFEPTHLINRTAVDDTTESVDLPGNLQSVSNTRPERDSLREQNMPTYNVPEVFEVDLGELELPADVPVDSDLTEKRLAECTKIEVGAAVKAFSGLLRQSQFEIEASIRKHNEIRRRVAHLHAYHENFETIDWVRGSDS